MRLSSVILSVVLLFLTSMVLLELRRLQRRIPSANKKIPLPVVPVLAALGLLFILIGKLALLIALFTLTIFFLHRSKA